MFRGRTWVAGAIHEDVVVVVEDGMIADVRLASRHDDPEPNLGDGVLVPGFIDAHIHGGAGADFMDATPEAARAICAHHLRHGTTALAATTLSGSRDAIGSAIVAIADAAGEQADDEATIVGINLEGPYLNRQKAGAQDPASIRPADIEETRWWRNLAPSLPFVMTVAPEASGVLDLIRAFHHDICFAIGHTAATYAETILAVEAGARHFTHLFNAMPPLHHREPGAVGAALADDRCTVELIADGIHLHHAMLHVLGAHLHERAILMTDAMRACGMPEGTYSLYQHQVTVRDGAARLADGALAGSILTMGQAVRNMVEIAALPIETILPLATTNPARLLGLGDSKGRIAAGYDADLLVLSPRLEVERVIVRGHEVATESPR
jgi:N-acetylglucosamine-6-phosphate deacetylase